MSGIDYNQLLAHLQEPGGIRIAEQDLLTQMHHLRPASELRALGDQLYADRFIRRMRPVSLGTSLLVLRVTMSLAASEANALLPRVEAGASGHMVRTELAQQVHIVLDQITFKGSMLLPSTLSGPLDQIYGRLTGATGISARFRKLVFQISQAILWLNERGLRSRSSVQERLLYSFELESEKFWRIRRIRQKPVQWEMSHGRIHVSESRRNAWDQEEAFQRLRNKLLAGYWESATTAGPGTALESVQHLYEDMLETMVYAAQNTDRQRTLAALWYLLLQRALPVREGLALGDVTLGPTPTLPSRV